MSKKTPLQAYGERIVGDFEGPSYVRGHVPFGDAFTIVCRDDGNDPKDWTYTARHLYGRFGQDASTVAGDWAYSLYEYDAPSSRRFPMTRIDYNRRKEGA